MSSSSSSDDWEWKWKEPGCGCKSCRKGKGKCKKIRCLITKELTVDGHKIPSKIFDKDFTVEVAMDANTLTTGGTPGTFGTSFSVRGVIFSEGALSNPSTAGFIGLDANGQPVGNLANCVLGEWIQNGIWTDTYPNPNPFVAIEHPNVFARQLFNFDSSSKCFFGDIITDGEQQTPRIAPWERVIVGGTHQFGGIRGTQLMNNIPNPLSSTGLSQNATMFSSIPNGSQVIFNGYNFRVTFCSLR